MLNLGGVKEVELIETERSSVERALQTLRSLIVEDVVAASTARGTPSHLEHQHHVILVPYRDRPQHRRLFLEHMAPYLQRNYCTLDSSKVVLQVGNATSQSSQQLIRHTFSIWIVEQDNRDLFNMGWLIDVGLAEIFRANLPGTTNSCIIKHDIDLIPAVDGVPYHQCTPYPMHLASELEHLQWKCPYEQYVGAAISLHVDHWQRINGYSLAYQGWGAEDDDAFYRIKRCGLTKTPRRPDRPAQNFGRFTKVDPHHPEHHVRKKIHWHYLHNLLHLIATIADTRCEASDDGLSSVQYRLTDFQVENFVLGNASIPIVSIKATT
jgi:N-terminal domain of galactosyltransferase/N-terminal region of glycosyl transferase group 7